MAIETSKIAGIESFSALLPIKHGWNSDNTVPLLIYVLPFQSSVLPDHGEHVLRDFFRPVEFDFIGVMQRNPVKRISLRICNDVERPVFLEMQDFPVSDFVAY